MESTPCTPAQVGGSFNGFASLMNRPRSPFAECKTGVLARCGSLDIFKGLQAPGVPEAR